MFGAFSKAAPLLAAVSWEVLIKETPKIVDAALKLHDRVRSRNKGWQRPDPDAGADSPQALRRDVKGILERLDALEDSESAQAELISKMVVQEEALLRGLQALSTRVTALYWALAVTVAVAAAALLFALLWR